MTAATRILVVEDSPTQLAQLRFTLEEAGFVVWVATDGDEALEVARAHPVDVVVSDVVMPRLDGFGLCERIRRDGDLGNLPVILLTAMSDPMDVLRALEAGADGFVRKPYDPEQLVARVRTILATAERRSVAPDDTGLTIRLGSRDHYLSQERLQFLDVLGSSFRDMEQLLPDAPVRPGAEVRVLVAEDSPTELAKLRFVLEECGATITAVTDGSQALAALEAALEADPFDLVFTDVVMPVLDGRALCRAIRADERFRRLPVVMITSLASADDILAGLEAGATNFIPKPYDEAYLATRVRSIFAGQAGRLRRPAAAPIDLDYGGRHFSITADRMQMLDLLVASYDHTVQQNSELRQVRDELQQLNGDLEDRVADRTRELLLQIEERVRADARRDEVEAQLRASQRAEGIGALAGGIAHDFNNLLSVIIGYTEMALELLPERDPSRAHLTEAVNAADRAAALTAQLLAFSRKQVHKPVPLSLNAVTESLTGMLRRIVGEDVELVELLAPDLGLVMADPTQIQQVIMNIVVNARDAMPAGGTLTIQTANAETGPAGRLSPVVDGPCVTLSFRDTGTGMDRATMDRIFEPFYTTKEPGKGTGLGMATVHGIVRQSGGEILVESEPGFGTTLRIVLPRLAMGTAVEAVDHAPRAATHGTETILVVEDEAGVRSLTARRLRDAGYTVIEAENGAAALAASGAHAGPIDLLLTDVVMPGLSGPQLAVQFAGLYPRAALLFMSGYTDDLIARHGLRPDQAPMLDKPFSRERLLQMIRAALDTRGQP